ncbi:Rgp1-domain-containing protein [Rhizopogon vinicolor AM-OR11-026]|uniref:Rgp1-domain-containing protein n=1 Tax=Rhizopogon vinicolor AM-OR11-026 TaxID=1314800 RepID=A0A1B7MYS8_9AGAM|nr:Rgp1-domain-containing protein [Rhizopogon vinicolor AM-OR11-026]
MDAENIDPSIRVQVLPSQNAYFAGESFSVTITFTNTRLPVNSNHTQEPASAPIPAQKSHKRNAHSISSAPLARPPTSPGLGSRPPDIVRALGNGIGDGRKGLIGNVHGVETGKGKGKGKEVLEAQRSALKSVSVDIEANGHEEYVQAYQVDSATHRTSFPLPHHHPHARKHSVFDGHLQLNEVQSQVQPSPPLPSSSSASTFTLALDPIAETPQSPTPSTPSLTSSTTSEVHSYPPRPSPTTKSTHSALGNGHPSLPIPKLTSHKPLPPNTTLLLYSYLQLSGTAHILPHGPAPPALAHLRAQLLKRPVLGGGSMDIARSRTRTGSVHSRSASLTGSLFSLLTPSTFSPSPSRSRAPSLGSQSDLSVGVGAGVGLGVEEGDEEIPLPVFEVQPAMLAVDLTLSPGESRSYTYTLPLPSTLPPTFRGRMMRFSYELSVGTCRRGDGEGGSAVTVSRVMKVPIRVYNWVSLSKPQHPYDLLAPMRKPDAGKVLDLGSAGGDGGLSKKPTEAVIEAETEADAERSKGLSPALDDLRAYGGRLLSTFPTEGSTGVRIKEPVESVPENVSLPSSSSSSSSLPSGSGSGSGAVDPLRVFAKEREREREEDDDEVTGCREAVEILTRNPKKVSYDVTKDGLKVAVLTFPKSAYRLGETILGIVEINERGGRGKVVSLSATLETNESLPASLVPPSTPTPPTAPTTPAHARRIHAEHHASFTGSTLRTTFALDIPSDACPGFGVVVSGSSSSSGKVAGGLTWKVHLTLLVAVTAPNARVRGLVRDGASTAWGTAWRAPGGIAPEEQEQGRKQTGEQGTSVVGKDTGKQSWTSYLMSSFLGTGEREYHDGDDIDDDDVPSSSGDADAEGDKEDDWRELQVEVVECEVPVVVWPGSTAFSAVDVVFDV